VARPARNPSLNSSPRAQPHEGTGIPDPRAPLQRRVPPSLLDRLHSHAAAFPERVAIDAGEARVTYRDLDDTTSAGALFLGRSGIRRGQVVAIDATRSAALVIAMVATLKAGVAFVILDPAYPANRSARYLQIARPVAVIKLRNEASNDSQPSFRSIPHITLPRDVSASDAPMRPAGDELAYVSFTSGSTGSPKGIIGTHAPLWHFLEWYAAQFNIRPTDSCALLSGLSHDPLFRDVFAPLWAGGCVRIPSPSDWPASFELLHWLRHSGVTIIHLTPIVARLLLESVSDRRFTLPRVRLVCFGGDLLRYSDVADFRRLAPKATFVNFYGATETPQAAAWFQIPRSHDQGGGSVPIGKGIPDVQLLVFKGDQQAQVGELGEVCIRTSYLANGYCNNLRDGATRFVPNPFTGDPSDRMYRSGDLGRYLPTGDVEWLGRMDRQVKIRGVRVEPLEVEALLRSHSGIRDVAVVPVHRDREVTLRAYLIAKASPLDPEELTAFCRRQVPDAMVPQDFVSVRRFPVTPNGKIDFVALQNPDYGPASELGDAVNHGLQRAMRRIAAETPT